MMMTMTTMTTNESSPQTSTTNSSPIEPLNANDFTSSQNGAAVVVTSNGGDNLQVNCNDNSSNACNSTTATTTTNEQDNNNNGTNNAQISANEQEDEDEDVREAKANIRGHLERMRETEKFLKTVHEEEDKLQKQRQDLIMFNNLLLSTKLSAINGVAGAAGAGAAKASLGNSNSSLHRICPSSAPIACYSTTNQTGHLNYNGFNLNPGHSSDGHHHHYHSNSIDQDHQYSQAMGLQQQHVNSFQGNHAESNSSPISCFSSDLYKPNYVSTSGGQLASAHYRFTSTGANLNATYESENDPLLEPVQPLKPAYYMPIVAHRKPSWRRSKSQLGDQFNDYDCTTTASIKSSNMSCLAQQLDSSCPAASLSLTSSSSSSSRRPLSANIESLITSGVGGGSSSTRTAPYLPSRQRRSVSQIRHHQPAATIAGPRASGGLDYFSTGDYNASPANMMSEYKSSFGPNLGASGAPRPSRSPIRRATSPLIVPAKAINDGDDDDDDDDEMRAYRASSYVPRVVPEGGPPPPPSSSSKYMRGRSLNRTETSLLDTGKLYERGQIGGHSGDLETPASRRRSTAHLRETFDFERTTDCRRDSDRFETTASVCKRRSSTSELTRSDCGASRLQSAGISARLDNNNNNSSRLSELEQRIQANKRRREELLSEIKSGVCFANNNDDDNGHDNKANADDESNQSIGADRTARSASRLRRGSSAAANCSKDNVDKQCDEHDLSPFEHIRSTNRRDNSKSHDHETTNRTSLVATTRCSNGSPARARPSRLESMEARIKRRSYCVQVSPPNLSKTNMSLQHQTATSRTSSLTDE